VQLLLESVPGGNLMRAHRQAPLVVFEELGAFICRAFTSQVFYSGQLAKQRDEQVTDFRCTISRSKNHIAYTHHTSVSVLRSTRAKLTP
jgi:hypothetical protein